MIFSDPVVIFDHFKGEDEIGRVWLVGPNFLRGAYLVEREFSCLKFLPRERKGGSVDIGEYDKPVVFRELSEGVAGIGEQRPIFYGLTERSTFLFRSRD